MKIIFIIPPLLDMKSNKEWDLDSALSVSPPIGALILCSILKKKGHEVKLIDAYAQRMSISEILCEVSNYKPNVVGISFMSIAYNSAYLLAARIKKSFFDICIIAGGPHISALAYETIKTGVFDVGVIGEGEQTFPELLEALENKYDLYKIQGIVFRDSSGSVVQTPRRDYIQDIDNIPFPDWDMIDFRSYRLTPVGIKGRIGCPLFTARGCPNQCVFCDRSVMGNKIRAHSAEYVISMLEEVVKKYRVREFIFYDDTFGVLEYRDTRLCEQIIRKKFRISWSCCTRIDTVTKELLRLMKKAGCWQVQYGIESGSQEILNRMRKNIQLNEVKNAVNWAKNTGMQVRGNFILGFPGETKQTMEETINLALSLKIDYMQQFFLTPFPGSEIYQDAVNSGKFYKDWNKMNEYTLMFIPTELSREDLVRYSKMMYKKFYLRPRIFFSHILWLIRNPEMCLNYWRLTKVFIKTITR